MRLQHSSAHASQRGPTVASRPLGTSSAPQMSSMMEAQSGKPSGVGRSCFSWAATGSLASVVTWSVTDCAPVTEPTNPTGAA